MTSELSNRPIASLAELLEAALHMHMQSRPYAREIFLAAPYLWAVGSGDWLIPPYLDA